MAPGDKRQYKEKNWYLRPLPLILSAVVALVAVTAILEITNTTHFFHKRKAVSSTIPASKSTGSGTADGSKSDDSQSASDENTTSQPPTSDKSTAPPTSGAELLAPSGNFVSNHRPSLGETPSSSTEESICTTTPGAFCTITFKKDGVTKTLESLQTDGSGTVIWQWDVKSAGFIPGTWTVTATATLNGQTKSADDLQPLEVQP
ncbi:MAG TPA: hypothetical protein VFT58_01600 [Nitrososphaera sp.]|nr:hypothetical protein [Nitrososphaera sp.]